MKILLIGISTRALAQSATRAGQQVISLDFFGDSDQPKGAEVISLVRDLGMPPTLPALTEAAKEYVPLAEKVIVEAGLENEPMLVEICPPEKRWGNTAEAVRGCRDLRQLGRALGGTGVSLPETILPGEGLPGEGKYLVKDASHSGGMGVREWDGHTALEGQEVLQRFVEGELASACFLADGRRARLLGLTRQHAGEAALNAAPFAWCGNAAPWGSPELSRRVDGAVEALAEHFQLAGLNGVDFIVRGEAVTLLEVNPRPPASFELFERLLGVNAFRLHTQACEGKLPGKTFSDIPTSMYWGKGIFYAPRELYVVDTRGWEDQELADVPHEGEVIPKGAPVCTVFAGGSSPEDCWENILRRARGLFPD